MKLKFFPFLLALGIAGSLVLGFSSCGDDDDDLPPIDGYNNSNEVAATNLLAHWGFEGDGKETKSGTAPSKTVNGTFVTGAKGKGVKFDAGFFDYPRIPALEIATGSITLSAWAKISNTKQTPTGGSTISPIFSIAGGPNANIGNLALFGNTHGLTSSDSIQVKAEFHFDKGDGTEFGGDAINMTKKEPWMDDTHTVDPNKIGGKWAHIVYVYDGSTANNRIYVNGVKISNSAWESRNGGNPLNMKFFTPTRPIVGATQSVANGTNAEPWNAALKGEVDEIRVYNKPLTVAEIGALYKLEKAGR
ncbi:MAG: LamG domain-containing protein [Saprospiraceae bacterium]|nr:LamG domain-containing protein [Saprospiraceae bacterium]